MNRMVLLLFVLFTSLFASGQAGQANTYSIPLKDKRWATNSFIGTNEGADPLFFVGYFRGLARMSNTGPVYLKTDSLNDHFTDVKKINDSEYYVLNTFYIGKLQRDSVYTLIYDRKLNFTQYQLAANGLLYLIGYDEQDAQWLYCFDGKKLQHIKKLGTRQELGLYHLILDEFKHPYFFSYQKKGISIWAINKQKVADSISYKIKCSKQFMLNALQTKKFKATLYDLGSQRYYFYNERGIQLFSYEESDVKKQVRTYYPYYVYSNKIGQYKIKQIGDSSIVSFELNSNVNNFTQEPIRNTFIVGNAKEPVRVFPYLKKYPNLFGANNSASVFSLRQDHLGRIWAGSYQQDLSIIDGEKVEQPKDRQYLFMNAGDRAADKMYLLADWGKGLLRYDVQGNCKKLLPNFVGFCTYVSKDQKTFYLGGGGDKTFGLHYCSTSELLREKDIQWQNIPTNSTFAIRNVLCIAEDTMNRIWAGNGGGICLFNPNTNSKQTLGLRENKLSLGGTASLFTDSYGTMWIGSIEKGLWYYNKYAPTAKDGDFHQIIHPFWTDGQSILAITQYRNQLLISYADKLLLLNLDSFYQKQKTIIRYLNPQEANFTTTLEQNTLLVSAKDSSVWFSTSDQVYQWDIAQWLRFKTYKANPTVSIHFGSKSDTLYPSAKYELAPKQNSFQLKIDYHTPDLMPRYIQAWLRNEEGDSIKVPAPALETAFSFSNLKSGRYTFVVNVLEEDGTISHYQYPICLDAFWFEKPKYWLFIAICLSAIVAYVFYLRSKKEIESAKRKEAEARMAQWQAETVSELNKLKIASISNQFKPHFLLNTLNAVGSFLYHKPQAERLVDLIGKSVRIIFAQSSTGVNVHSLSKEWELIENVIEIFRILYIKELETSLPSKEQLQAVQLQQIPFGILQIPVENALLHGLHNRKSGPYLLQIILENYTNHLLFIIEDNGVGREKSASLSNVRKHGTGLKNLQETIRLYNLNNTGNEIEMEFQDNIHHNEYGEPYGTRVLIKIPKNYNYEF
ncbi:MAG: histidine kinase [Chitinophagaceae bacterium]|nr:histidine kinase [Chitinophagaceae bacterium]